MFQKLGWEVLGGNEPLVVPFEDGIDLINNSLSTHLSSLEKSTMSPLSNHCIISILIDIGPIEFVYDEFALYLVQLLANTGNYKPELLVVVGEELVVEGLCLDLVDVLGFD